MQKGVLVALYKMVTTHGYSLAAIDLLVRKGVLERVVRSGREYYRLV